MILFSRLIKLQPQIIIWPEFLDKLFNDERVAGAREGVESHAPAPEPHAFLVRDALYSALGRLNKDSFSERW